MSFIVIISYPHQPSRHVIVLSTTLCNKPIEAWYSVNGLADKHAKRCGFDVQTRQFVNQSMRTRGLRHFVSRNNWLIADNAHNARWLFVERALLNTLGDVLIWDLGTVSILRIDIASVATLADHQRATVFDALKQIHKISHRGRS